MVLVVIRLLQTKTYFADGNTVVGSTIDRENQSSVVSHDFNAEGRSIKGLFMMIVFLCPTRMIGIYTSRRRQRLRSNGRAEGSLPVLKPAVLAGVLRLSLRARVFHAPFQRHAERSSVGGYRHQSHRRGIGCCCCCCCRGRWTSIQDNAFGHRRREPGKRCLPLTVIPVLSQWFMITPLGPSYRENDSIILNLDFKFCIESSIENEVEL